MSVTEYKHVAHMTGRPSGLKL